MGRFVSDWVWILFRTGFASILAVGDSFIVNDVAPKPSSSFNCDTTAYWQLVIQLKDKAYRSLSADIARQAMRIDMPLALGRPFFGSARVIKATQRWSGVLALTTIRINARTYIN